MHVYTFDVGVDAKVNTLCCVPAEYVISCDKCSIKTLKIAKNNNLKVCTSAHEKIHPFYDRFTKCKFEISCVDYMAQSFKAY